jgi:hypothetical protein
MALVIAVACGGSEEPASEAGEPLTPISDRFSVSLNGSGPYTPNVPFELTIECPDGLDLDQPPLVLADFSAAHAGHVKMGTTSELEAVIVSADADLNEMILLVDTAGLIPPGEVDLRVACWRTAGVFGSVSFVVEDYEDVAWQSLVPIESDVDFSPNRLVGSVSCAEDRGARAIFGEVEVLGEANPAEIEVRSTIEIAASGDATVVFDEPLTQAQSDANTVMILCSESASSTALVPRVYMQNVFYRNG